jgi:D-alanyl-D-alanine carboxypeptidase/D-alanyl-D-alanine-endopeptidase (penicillin-binding protein 4)
MCRKLFSAVIIVLVYAGLLNASDKDRSKKFDKNLAKQIDAILARPELAPTQWGIDVVSLDDHRTLYALNEEKLFIPASNCKLITTAATLAMVGPDYRFHTTVESIGQLDGRGRIIGDVSLVGRGDPNLSGRDLPYNI